LQSYNPNNRVIFRPADPILRTTPFDDANFFFQLKHDGFSALARISGGVCKLESRRGNVYKSYAELCGKMATIGRDVALDGEIVVLDSDGRSLFYQLIRRRGTPVFYAFDYLTLDGIDLRKLSLIERKRRLEQLVNKTPGVLYAQHTDGAFGRRFFDEICARDLEGVVTKRRDGGYGEDWFKIRNPRYSQREGRGELLERKR
jgi:bifunctional non-homologous end joining protein LigD